MVGHMLENEAAVDILEIPDVLRKPVAEKVRDGLWIQTHRTARNYSISCNDYE